MKVMDIDGDEFAEADYGLVVDNSNAIQELQQKMDMLAQAALQNQALNFSTIMKLYNSCSMAEKQRMVERNEQELIQRQQEAQQQQLQQQQQQAEMEAQAKEQEMQLKDMMNQRDNETKILVATISANSNQESDDGIIESEYSQEAKDKLMQQMKEFDAKMTLERDKLSEQKRKNRADESIKLKQINKSRIQSK